MVNNQLRDLLDREVLSRVLAPDHRQSLQASATEDTACGHADFAGT